MRRWEDDEREKMGKEKKMHESKETGKRKKMGKRKRRAFVVFAVHESSSDPIMTEAALPLSPTANLRLHVFNTHHTHTNCHCYFCGDIL